MLNMFSEDGKQYGDLQNFLTNFCENSLAFPKPNELLIIQFIFSINSLAAPRLPPSTCSRGAARASAEWRGARGAPDPQG